MLDFILETLLLINPIKFQTWDMINYKNDFETLKSKTGPGIKIKKSLFQGILKFRIKKIRSKIKSFDMTLTK
ncbi:hypothetical protein BpHYR1_050593 [Brachionus plicatilis]|uniref:Uncharacterized protein n=1 Tax=Brachionus plicatilis TaxID=10195 RepID=A0A3M7S3T7_BRAPC|nr:hypothetical protein BpHYR1_050593 [Brachionus plicatilis]